MKKTTISAALVAGCLLLGGLMPVSAAGYHRFTSADGSKRFSGQVMAYDAASDTVLVKLRNGKRSKFPADKLSEEDREYVKSMGTKILAAKALRIAVDIDRHSDTREKVGTWIQKTTPYSYGVTINNGRNVAFENVEVDYSVYVEREPKGGGAITVETISGTHDVGKVSGSSKVSFRTDQVEVIEWEDNPPVPKGGGGGGG